MATVETLIERNNSFASERFTPLPVIPPSRTLVITCADVRVDPAHILGLRLGEAAVIRNVGGRVTGATVQMLAMLAAVAAAEGASDGWELVLLHHTDCGITRLARHTELLSAYFDVSDAELSAKAVCEPAAAVAADLAALAANPLLPSALLVSGLVYDVASGSVSVVDGPRPLRNDAE
jgi:carbonic anhydrase